MNLLPNAFLFTDGSSSKNDDIGAWGAVAITPNGAQKKILFGVTHPTTISRCELLPMIEGLRWIKANWYNSQHTGIYRVTIVSDSEYTVRTAAGDYARKKNMELWSALDEAASAMEVQYIWRERNTNYYTEVCDAVCGSIRRIVIDNLKQKFEDVRKLENELMTVDLTQFME